MRAFEIIIESSEDIENVPVPSKKYTIQIPRIPEAFEELKQNTNWRYRREFDSDTTYIITNNETGEKWKWNFARSSYLKQNGAGIRLADFLKEHKIAAFAVIRHFGGLINVFGTDPLTWLQNRLIPNPTEEMKIAAVRKSPPTIAFIDHPSLEVQLEAIMGNPPNIIEYIKRPFPRVQIEAIKQNPESIEFIRKGIKIPMEAQLHAVNYNGYLISHIDDQAPAVQMAAVKQNPGSVMYIDNIDPNVQKYVDSMMAKKKR